MHKEDERMINKLVDKIKKTNAPIVASIAKDFFSI